VLRPESVSFDVHAFDDPAPFIQRAEPWLLRAEAENNLLLGIAARLTKSTEGYEAPITLYTIEENGETAGCAWRTPPWGLGVTRMPQAAIPALVEEVAAVYTTIPTVMGPVPTAGSVAEHWSRRKGTSFREEMRQRIYQLNRVTWPKPLASGSLRLVEPSNSLYRRLGYEPVTDSAVYRMHG
jgi:hypothetical protein